MPYHGRPSFDGTAVNPRRACWSAIQASNATSTSGEGRVEGLLTGRHKGSVPADGYSIGDLDADLPKAGEVQIDVTLSCSSAIRLRILDVKGNPEEHAGVTIVNAAGAGPAWRFVYAKLDGTAFVIRDWTTWTATPPGEANMIEAEGRVEGLALGRYMLRVKEGDAVREVPFEVVPDREGDVEVKLGP